MNFEDFELEEIPYWCLNCDAPTVEVLSLPEPLCVEPSPIYEVCEVCYTALCESELKGIRQHQLRGETCSEWVNRCNSVREKYGLGADHAFCETCCLPQPHDPDCVECSDDISTVDRW